MNGNMNVLFHIVIPVAALIWPGVSAWITKCTERKQHRLIMNCPDGHVIYRPMIDMGVSSSGTCRFQDGDCKGLSQELENLKNLCFWKSSCRLSWNNAQKITLTKNMSCHGTKPTYVMYDNPLCIKEDNIIDMNSKDNKISSLSEGVIRSSMFYPESYKDVKRTCTKVLPARQGHVLVLSVDHLSTPGFLKIYTESEREKKQLLYKREAEEETFEIDGSNVTVVFNVTHLGNPGKGFVIRFVYRKNGISNKIKVINSVMVGPVRQTSTPNFNVKGSLDTCIIRKDALSIVCPPHHVIYKPDVTTGVSNGRSCAAKPGDCKGLTHTLITQINRCYWRGQCGLRWTRGVPLTMTNTLNCLAQMPSYISVRGYQCIRESNVFEICGKDKFINATEGIIKSHPNYPWHYPTKPVTCRKFISVNKDHGLRIYTESIDLDPDSKGDNIKFYLNNERNPRKKLIGGQRADIPLAEGCLKIEFRVSKRSKGGKGFVLKFEPATNNEASFKKQSDDSCMIHVNKGGSNQYVSDTEKVQKKKDVTRQKGKRKRKRGGKKKGKGNTNLSQTPMNEEGRSKNKLQNTERGRKNKEGRKDKRRGRKRRKGKKYGKKRRKGRKRGRKDRRRWKQRELIYG